MKVICQSFVLTMTVCIDTSSVESFHVGSYEQATTFDMQVDITSQRRIKTIIWKLMDFTFNPESLFYVWVIAKLTPKVCVILLTFSNYEPSTKSLPLSKKCTHLELFWSIFSLIRKYIFFDASLDSKGNTPKFKSRSISKLIELNKTLDLCDIWRIRNPKKRKYTSRQKHLSGIIQRRLDYIFISQNLQEFKKI